MKKFLLVFAAILVFFFYSLAADTFTDNADELIGYLVKEGNAYCTPQAKKARVKLEYLGVDVFPELVDNVHDARPAWPCLQQETINETTVGDVCFELVRWQVQKSFYTKMGPHFLTKESLEDWWAERRGRSLLELQVEALEWAIQEVKTNAAYGRYPEDWLERMESKLRQLR